jgi:hypothetical protein
VVTHHVLFFDFTYCCALVNLEIMRKADKIIAPAVWTGTNFENDQSWFTYISEDEIHGLDVLISRLDQYGLSFPNYTRDDIEIGPIEKTLDQISVELEDGRGFHLLRGLPLERYNENQINNLYYAIGLYMGVPVKQNPKGDFLGLVMNVGDISKKDTRVYETNLYLPYHTDPSDVVGLLCVRPAQRGGMSSLVSAAAIYNRILEQRPDLVEVYYEQFCYAHLGADKHSPIFSFHQGKLSCRYLRQYIELGFEQMGIAIPAKKLEALDLFDSVMMAPEMRIDMMLKAGDIQFANNYAVLHSRSAFDDHPATDRRRKKLRLWLKMPNARQLAPDFPGRNGFS